MKLKQETLTKLINEYIDDEEPEQKFGKMQPNTNFDVMDKKLLSQKFFELKS